MTPTQRARYRRRQILIARKFQLKFVGLILLFVFLSALLASFTIYYTMMILMGQKLASVYPQGMLASILTTVNLQILASFLLISPLVIIIAIILSLRIAGPVYRIDRFLRQIAAGDYSSRITLRAKDEFKVIGDTLNQMTDNLQAVIVSQRERVLKASHDLKSIKKSLDHPQIDRAKMGQEIENLDKIIEDLDAELAKYKLQ